MAKSTAKIDNSKRMPRHSSLVEKRLTLSSAVAGIQPAPTPDDDDDAPNFGEGEYFNMDHYAATDNSPGMPNSTDADRERLIGVKHSTDPSMFGTDGKKNIDLVVEDAEPSLRSTVNESSSKVSTK